MDVCPAQSRLTNWRRYGRHPAELLLPPACISPTALTVLSVTPAFTGQRADGQRGSAAWLTAYHPSSYRCIPAVAAAAAAGAVAAAAAAAVAVAADRCDDTRSWGVGEDGLPPLGYRRMNLRAKYDLLQEVGLDFHADRLYHQVDEEELLRVSIFFITYDLTSMPPGTGMLR